MFLTKEYILSARECQVIHINPFDPNLVGINSVDVRLGPDLFQLKRDSIYRNLYAETEQQWEPVEPVVLSHHYPELARYVGDAEGFILLPGRFYIGTTLEEIGTNRIDWDCFDGLGTERLLYSLGKSLGRFQIVPEMNSRSTTGRNGLTVAKCAGLGDVGYRSRWAIEISVEDGGAVPLAVGTAIGQVTFALATDTQLSYGGEGRYQTDTKTRFLPKRFTFPG